MSKKCQATILESIIMIMIIIINIILIIINIAHNYNMIFFILYYILFSLHKCSRLQLLCMHVHVQYTTHAGMHNLYMRQLQNNGSNSLEVTSTYLSQCRVWRLHAYAAI